MVYHETYKRVYHPHSVESTKIRWYTWILNNPGSSAGKMVCEWQAY
jgi:hypothetical protein